MAIKSWIKFYLSCVLLGKTLFLAIEALKTPGMSPPLYLAWMGACLVVGLWLGFSFVKDQSEE